MQRITNTIYPISEAIEIIQESAPTQIYVLTECITTELSRIAKQHDYMVLPTSWTNVVELLKRGSE